MSSLRRFLARLVNALRPGRAEPEFEREIASHLALIEEDYVRRGLSPEEAALAARRALGSVALIASCIPARRATKVDPIEALRSE